VTLPNDQDASGRSFGDAELEALRAVLESGTLISTKGQFVKRFERTLAARLGVKHAFACTSGSAAIHTALAALDLEPGDEVVTTSITDMGALTPIVYQAAIPVFADVDPLTCNVTRETIEAALSPKTAAIIVTHLFGNPCDMEPIEALARERGIPIVEDCAQAYLATDHGRNVGSIGALGCFSLQQGKHITCGEGGVVVTDDDALARRVMLFINKAWGYGDAHPDHYFAALNYRLSELQGAVAYAQVERLDQFVDIRRTRAAELTAALAGVGGIAPPYVAEHATHSYWKYALRIDSAIYPEGPHGFARLLKGYDVAAVPRYIQKPAFMCEVFQARATFGSSQFPFSLARPEAIDYRAERFPGTAEALEDVLVLPLNERYTSEHVAHVAHALRAAADQLRVIAA
jgi:dTDP-4-amino-4,6-dideoxygalactose transaminase